MPSNDLHMCIFCGNMMDNVTNLTYATCKMCNVHKDRFAIYFFIRSYKGKSYQFEYDMVEQKFTLTDANASYDGQIIMQSDDLYLITPNNWEKKIQTILVFS
jgi:hypothetical protein